MHMVPDITQEQGWMEIEDEKGEVKLVSETDLEEIDSLLPVAASESVKFTRRVGFGARMSVPGCMDCTDWAVFDTEEDAAEYLSDMYFEGPLDEMDQHQLECLLELVEIMGDQETEERIAEMLGLLEQPADDSDIE